MPRPFLPCLALVFLAAPLTAGNTRNIMLTGYWPPTNEAVRHFSPNPDQNPGGWQGANWEDRGYDVYSFFPEFDNFPSDRQGEGDFEVDYQDTSADWWRITSEINPVAIITFSAGTDGLWELEMRQRNLFSGWVRDYENPRLPTPRPPDPSMPPGGIRYSSLPMQEIVDAVNDAGLDEMTAVIDDVGFGGAFLSEYIAYHGTWYHDLHANPQDPFRNVAAGHIHVGPDISVEQARIAAEISVRTLLDYVDLALVPEPLGAQLAWLAGLAICVLQRRRVPSRPPLPLC